MTIPILKTAQELRWELDSKKTQQLDAVLTLVAKVIHANASKGSVVVLSLSDGVVQHLKGLGYKVKFYQACNCGDMDSPEISW